MPIETLRQKYGLRIALRPQNAMEAVTYMNLQAVQAEIKLARDEARDAKFECVNVSDDESIFVILDPKDIQLVMHHKWVRPQPQDGQRVPMPNLPNLRSM